MTVAPGKPTVIVFNDSNPCPRMEITVVPGSDNKWMTVYRNPGRVEVRGAKHEPVAGTFVVIDTEVPIGEEVTYYAVGYDASDVPSANGPASASAALPADGGCPWVHDPLEPLTSVRWKVTDWTERNHGREQETLWPIMSTYAVVVMGMRRRPMTAMTVWTKTDSEAASMRLLISSRTIMIRPMPDWQWKAGYFVTGDEVREVRRKRGTGSDPERMWTIPLIPVAQPPAELDARLYAWEDIPRLYATWNAVPVAKASWRDLVANPDPGQ